MAEHQAALGCLIWIELISNADSGVCRILLNHTFAAYRQHMSHCPSFANRQSAKRCPSILAASNYGDTSKMTWLPSITNGVCTLLALRISLNLKSYEYANRKPLDLSEIELRGRGQQHSELACVQQP